MATTMPLKPRRRNPQRRTPMIPHFRWVLVDRHGRWRIANQTYANRRIARQVRDRGFPKGGTELVRDTSGVWVKSRLDVMPVRVWIGPVRKAKR